MLMAVCSFSKAATKEAYAVYNNGTLTFYYDTSKSSRTGDKYDINNYGSVPGWYTSHCNDIKKVVFKSSFKDARPKSTRWWFAAKEDEDWNILSQLTTITGIQYLNTSEVTDMSCMFYNCNQLTTIDVTGFDMSKVTTTESMFYFCDALETLDVSNWNTSNITNMYETFSNCSSLEALDVSNWNTSKVTNMGFLFFYCCKLSTLDVSNWNTANVENMGRIFEGCQNVTSLDVSKWNTAKAKDMNGMFDECYKLTSIDVSKWNTANVTDMSRMFCQCKLLTSLDLSSFNTTNVTDMNHMFSGDSELTTIYVGDKWNTDNLSATQTWSGEENGWVDMFEGCTSLKGEQGTTYDSNYVGKEYAHVDGGTSNPGYLSTVAPVEAYAVLSSTGKTLTFYYDNKKNTRSGHVCPLNTGDNYPEWYNDEWDEGNPNKITKVVFNSSFKDARPTSTFYWFYGQEHLTTITGIKYLNTSKVTTMESMFHNCSSLASLDLSKFKTSNVTNMSNMFYNCSSLTSLDLSSFNTSKVNNMSGMFSHCMSLTSIDLSSFNTSKVKYMDNMFSSCERLTYLDLSNFNTGSVIDMNSMFGWCTDLTSVDLGSFNTSNVTNMSWMFYRSENITSLDLESFNTSNVTDMSYMFGGCSKLTTIYVGDDWNTDNLQTTAIDAWTENGWAFMFNSCTSIQGEQGTTYDDYESSNYTFKDLARIDGGPNMPGYLTSASCLFNMSITGTKVTRENCKDILGDGKFSYDPMTKTLTVKGDYRYDSNERIIHSSIFGLTINVAQDAVLENKGDVILCSNSTTIKGDGKLTLKSNEVTGIYITHGTDVTIENMNLDIYAKWGIAGPPSSNNKEKLTIKSSNVTITTSTVQSPDASAICDLPGGIVLEGCSITYPFDATIRNNGVYSGDNLVLDVTITAGSGIATGVELQDTDQRSKIKGQSEEWYTIDGRKLSGKPAKEGIYLHNGKKVVKQ